MKEYEYKAVKVKQAKDGQPIIMFGAPAVEIEEWGGVPQKKELGGRDGTETTGFQRDEDPDRINKIGAFYSNPSNTIQNPLLIAPRTQPGSEINFFPTESSKEDEMIQHGKLVIKVKDLNKLNLLELLQQLKDSLIQRVPEFASRPLLEDMVNDFKERAGQEGHELLSQSQDEEDEAEENSESNNDDNSSDVEAALFSEESHVMEFFDEVNARIAVINEIPDFDRSEFLGFNKDAIISFLKPAIIVDGQHRLMGALTAARNELSKEPYSTRIEELVQSGATTEEIEPKLLLEVSRRLPVSMLFNSDPAEHVFQFVIVNQKATPIGKALLGTIVATTLSNEENERVSSRLIDSGIQIEEARHVAFLSRDPSSPFCNFVERGLSSDGNSKLPFNVLVELVKVFRDLKGGKLWGSKLDYADLWSRNMLESSQIISDWHSQGYTNAREFWRSQKGPWRMVFIEFWNTVREQLASDDPDSHNYWGDTRKSNIFNKIYLQILAADFFKHLNERRKSLDTIESIRSIVTEDWLETAKPSYFARDWKLAGIKKDSPGIRKQWANLWVNYREGGGNAPRPSEFRISAP
jgi:hypothetical protein